MARRGRGDAGGSAFPGHLPNRPGKAALCLCSLHCAVGQVRAETMSTFSDCSCHGAPGDGGPGIPVESEPRVSRRQISTLRVGPFGPAGGAKAQIR